MIEQKYGETLTAEEKENLSNLTFHGTSLKNKQLKIINKSTFMISISQSSGATIKVFCNGEKHTTNFIAKYGDKLSTEIEYDEGYENAGINFVSGIATKPIEIKFTILPKLKQYTLSFSKNEGISALTIRDQDNKVVTSGSKINHGSILTISATLANQTAQYTYSNLSISCNGLNINNGDSITITKDLTITANTDRTIRKYTFTINNDAGGIITVTCEGKTYTSTFEAPYGQKWTATFTNTDGYTGGQLLNTSGTVTGVTTVSFKTYPSMNLNTSNYLGIATKGSGWYRIDLDGNEIKNSVLTTESCFPWNEIQSRTVDENYMVFFPKFYTKTQLHNGQLEYYISKTKLDGFHCHPAFMNNGVEAANGIEIAQYYTSYDKNNKSIPVSQLYGYDKQWELYCSGTGDSIDPEKIFEVESIANLRNSCSGSTTKGWHAFNIYEAGMLTKMILMETLNPNFNDITHYGVYGLLGGGRIQTTTSGAGLLTAGIRIAPDNNRTLYMYNNTGGKTYVNTGLTYQDYDVSTSTSGTSFKYFYCPVLKSSSNFDMTDVFVGSTNHYLNSASYSAFGNQQTHLNANSSSTNETKYYGYVFYSGKNAHMFAISNPMRTGWKLARYC